MTRLYAHRGSHRDLPENGLAAFARAIEEGAGGVELDVRTTRDDVVVVCHDPHLGRLRGRAAQVARLPYAYLRSQFDLPTLDEAIDLVTGAGLRLNIEVKGDVPDRKHSAACVSRALSRRSAKERGAIVLSSFDPVVLRALGATTDVPIGFLFDEANTGARRAALALALLRPDGVHPHHALCTPARVARWKRRGLFVNVWTVNDEARARELASLGADGLITDDVPRLRAALGA
ncbi:MAG: glycerophosphodiester phosphodiesterase [Sandaracinaceae bacterium]|nr:glycerophosphodiester phosphodiesterase [Sandaracinaceae bacterium]